MNDDGILPPADRRERGTLRAADSDRDQIAELLNVAFSEGRLSKNDYDSRLARALSARTYADLDDLVTDLPVPPAPDDPRATAARPTAAIPVARTNGLAVAGLILGWAAVVLAILLLIGVAAAAGMHGMHGMMR